MNIATMKEIIIRSIESNKKEETKMKETREIIKESSSTYLLNFLIHGKDNKQIKTLIQEELYKRGTLIK